MNKPMTEQDVVEVLMAAHRERLAAWRRELREKGVPLDTIETLAGISEAISRANLERDAPVILKDLAISGGTASH
jgi:hypothetical protein